MELKANSTRTKDPSSVAHDVVGLERHVDLMLAEEGRPFEEWLGRFGQGFYQVRNQLIVRALDRAAPRRILELACAGPFLAESVLAAFPSIELYACTNFSQRVLDYCRRHLEKWPQCEVQSLDANIDRARDLELALTGEYDTVLTSSLEHLQFDRELIQLLPQGTRVIFSVASFDDAEHFRWFENAADVVARFDDLLDFFGIWGTPEGLKWVASAIRRDRQASVTTSHDDDVSVSIVMPCHNAAPHLSTMLQSIAEQSGPTSFELIAIDNRCTDGSRQILDRWSAQLPMRILNAPDRANACYARNVGVAAARTDKILLVDADDELAPGYVDAMSRALDVSEFVTSRVDVEALNASWLRDCHGAAWQQSQVETYFGFLPASGPNMGVRRRLYEQIGGFPERFPGSQDIAFSWNAILVGARLAFVEEAVYRYRFRDTMKGLFLQTRNWGASNVLLFRTFRELGMPSRPNNAGTAEVMSILRKLLRCTNRTRAAECMTRLGYFVGRLEGSVRYRTMYL